MMRKIRNTVEIVALSMMLGVMAVTPTSYVFAAEPQEAESSDLGDVSLEDARKEAPVAVKNNETVTADLTFAGKDYEYTSTADGYVVFTVKNLGGKSIKGFVKQITSSATDRAVEDDRFNSYSKTASFVSKRFPCAAGTKIRCHLEAYNDTSKVEVTASQTESADWERELNDSRTSSTAFSSSGEVFGTTFAGGVSADTDFFNFSVPSDTKGSLALMTDQATGSINDGWQVFVYKDGKNDSVYSSNGYKKDDYIISDMELSAGKYYIEVRPAANAPVDVVYHLKLKMADSAMYRLYNPNSGEHFFTASTSEKNHLVSVGWKDEGTAWTAPSSGNPVYRLYNANGGEHHYTMNAGEKDHLVSVGWKYEGIGWNSDYGNTTPLYRVYNPNAFANNHHYTKDKKERDHLISIGWKDEGTAWYGK